ncbi:hypothetical protein [Kitasatospora cineracea]|uniref:Uncharacterized protein n=1 Tax=Kitasatospora cineracea TaxID=88074 RepID=A0A8G1XBA2_9ACTN|nr:hypothetical protein [Kitasatospora cineracea]ROR43474.1 hypothetical protein EDD39_1634 [Kitasatospora cineracea]
MKSLFDLVVPQGRASRRFTDVQTNNAFTAARRLMDEVFTEFHDVDHSFVKEFQTGGFSARVFELALFAALREQGHELDRTNAAPDFVARGSYPVAIEATTTNPPEGQDPDDVDPTVGALRLVPNDLPSAEQEFVFQAGKALRRKLLKRDKEGLAYWEQPHIAGLPFVIALESFHSASSLFHAIGPLATYLYGRRDVPIFDTDGTLNLSAEPVTEHEHMGKTIPSGLFGLPESAYLAALIFSNSATVSKFNRIGTELGYGPDDIAMIRIGTMPDPDPNAIHPQLFGYLVGGDSSEKVESFSEGWHVLHNPWAKNTLHPDALPGFTRHELLDDGRVLSTWDRMSPFASQTRIFEGSGAREYAQQMLERFRNAADGYERTATP